MNFKVPDDHDSYILRQRRYQTYANKRYVRPRGSAQAQNAKARIATNPRMCKQTCQPRRRKAALSEQPMSNAGYAASGIQIAALKLEKIEPRIAGGNERRFT
jgi:hypothetical protein